MMKKLIAVLMILLAAVAALFAAQVLAEATLVLHGSISSKNNIRANELGGFDLWSNDPHAQLTVEHADDFVTFNVIAR